MSTLNAKRPSDTPLPLLARSFLAAFVLEALLLFIVGWHDHWLAHPSANPDAGFVEAQIFDVPKENAHLVEEKKIPKAPAAPEKALSKVAGQGKTAKPSENKIEEENQTESGPKLAPTHGPVAIYTPAPVIPSYLQDKEIQASVVIDFYVNAFGKANPRLVNSSGNEELDAIALNTAKQWQFRAAEKDHQTIESKVRLRIVFEVH